MRLSVTQKNLSAALGIVGRAVSSRTTMPVLSNILLDATADQLRLSATNREIAITCWIPADVEDVGAITIPARLLTEYTNSLPPERIDMALTERTQTLRLSCARFEANMKGIDADEFPAVMTAAQVLASQDITITQASLPVTGLRGMIDRTTFAASADENRPTLTGVEVELSPDCVQLAATDGYRLSVNSLPISGGPDKTTVIVPARSLGELARITGHADEAQPVRLMVTPNRNQVMFGLTGTADGIQAVEMISELIDARFPDYRATIPKTHKTRTVVGTADLLKAARVALLFARDNANIIRLGIVPEGGIDKMGEVRLTAASAEMGDNVSELAATVAGDGLDVAFNARYLIDALSQIDQPQVMLETTVATRPGSLRPVGDDSFLHILMPMNPPR